MSLRDDACRPDEAHFTRLLSDVRKIEGRNAMNIFDGIEKLINERGSAKIIGERLLLAKDQNEAQEKRIQELESQLEKSAAEKATLRLDLQKCQNESKELTQKIQSSQGSPSRSDNDRKILELLAKRPGMSTEQIAQGLNHDVERTKYDVTELDNIRFIEFYRPPISFGRSGKPVPPTGWRLSHAGRGYMGKGVSPPDSL